MGRKRKTNYAFAGRPPVDPLKKVGRPVRALVTQPVMEAINQAKENSGGLNLSEIFRLALYEYLSRHGLITQELEADPTFMTLREKGIL